MAIAFRVSPFASTSVSRSLSRAKPRGPASARRDFLASVTDSPGMHPLRGTPADDGTD